MLHAAIRSGQFIGGHGAARRAFHRPCSAVDEATTSRSSPAVPENPFASLSGRFAPPTFAPPAPVEQRASSALSLDNPGDGDDDDLDVSAHKHVLQWYPGHIAKAERQLMEQLKMVDVVLEVRDARIPVSTCHPQVVKWVGPKPCLLIMNRVDMVTPAERRAWDAHFAAQDQRVFWTDGKAGGPGIKQVREALLAVSAGLNVKRARRGLQPRPVRACVIGFPNIGKSALINRLLNRRVVDSAPKPGVTRSLRWVRLAGELDLLDAPGVIPARFDDQTAAQRLAICNDIGEAAYVDSVVATMFITRARKLGSGVLARIAERYKCDPLEGSAEDVLQGVADRMFLGSIERAGMRVLKDYRTGALGSFALEQPIDVGHKKDRDALLVEQRRRETQGIPPDNDHTATSSGAARPRSATTTQLLEALS